MKRFRSFLLAAWTLLGVSLSGNAAEVTASFAAATDVPVSAASYIATGNTVMLSLGYAPITGTTLTVVKNTGLGFISGTFNNLPQGQAVALSYAGVSYNFVANYYGGSGNDLVLQWVGTRVMAWGTNPYGQLGDTTTAQRNLPVATATSGVLAGKTVIAVSGGYSHSLALCSDGTLAAWGDNSYGQLGDTSTTRTNVPVAVTTSGVLAGKTVIAVSTGKYHSLAVCSDGTVAAWGCNNYGQLGNSSTTNSNVPVAVTSTSGALVGKTVIAVSAGYHHSLALCADGTIAAWGNNPYGALGNNSTTRSNVPVAVTTSGVLAGKAAIAVSAGKYHSLAVCSDGTLAAWGYNATGQLGDKSITQRTVPVAVTTSSGALVGKTVVAVSAGSYHSLALCSDGTLAAWGYNFYGELGNNSTTNSLSPVAVTTASGALLGKTVVAVSAGVYHSLAVCSDGTLAAWGYNFTGQLGDNSIVQRLVPVAVSTTPLASGDRFFAKDAGAYHSLGLVAPAPAPTLVALAPINLAGTSATLNGTVNANGGSVAVSFEYGPSPEYGSTVVAMPATITGNTPTTVSAALSGLSPVSTYYYRVKSVTSGGTSTSAGSSFVTPKIAQTITFASLEAKTYGDVPFEVSATASSGLGVGFSIVSEDASVAATITDSTVTIIRAGTVTVRASQAGDATYAAATAVDQSFTVNKKTLSVVADAKHRRVGAATPDLTATISGFVGEDTAASMLSGSPYLITTATANSLPGSYPITVSLGNLTSANYTFVFSDGMLTVNALTLADWASDYFTVSELANPAISGPTADPDGDGLPNQLEYALGGDPWLAQAGLQPIVGISEGALTLSYTRRKDVGDLIYGIEVSSDLTDWISGATETQELTVTPLDAFRETVVVADRTPLTATGRRFMRLKVSQ